MYKIIKAMIFRVKNTAREQEFKSEAALPNVKLTKSAIALFINDDDTERLPPENNIQNHSNRWNF